MATLTSVLKSNYRGTKEANQKTTPIIQVRDNGSMNQMVVVEVMRSGCVSILKVDATIYYDRLDVGCEGK